MTQTQEQRTDRANQILDVAEHLIQVRGFNAFSYADVAGELGLTNAALHYHFPTKSELGEALIVRYAIRFSGALNEIDKSRVDPQRKLDAYVGLYAEVLLNQRMCLCGMLAAEYETLSAGMQVAVASFFEKNETWLDEARAIVSGLEGAMLIARSFGDINRFQSAASHLLDTLRG